MNANLPISDAPVGTSVKLSGHATQRQHDHYLSCGREPQKTYAREAYEKLIAKRGILTANNRETGCTVTWENGSTSTYLSYMLVSA